MLFNIVRIIVCVAFSAVAGLIVGLLTFEHVDSCQSSIACAYGQAGKALLIGVVTAIISAAVLIYATRKKPGPQDSDAQ